jgi:DHA1 family bicyclomycin/chloramphenicol resistance-like MFS transporter
MSDEAARPRLPPRDRVATVRTMMHDPSPAVPRGFAFAEFVTLIAVLMALTALSIDVMLVALPAIAGSFAVATANGQQLVITAYLIGFAAGQPVYGPLSDRFGRKPILTVGLVVFAFGSVAAFLAPGFGWLLAARVLQGFGAAAPRVVAVAVVRDLFSGRDMARVMSFAMMVFIVIPIVAPSLGAAILGIAEWHAIFIFLVVMAVLALVWSTVRLPETRPPADTVDLSRRALGHAFATVVGQRRTVGYTVASGFLFGSLMAYVASAQQIFVEVYGLGDSFPLIFGAVASAMVLASFANTRLVGRLGMRRISHVALVGFVAAPLAMALAGFPEHPPLLLMGLFFAVAFFTFGLMFPNFNAMAMEPVGHVAGMASSFIGFYTTAASALLGWIVGQAFDGTVRPLVIGFVVLGGAAVAAVLLAERGRLSLWGGTAPVPQPERR